MGNNRNMDKNEEIDNDCNEQEKRNNEDPGAARLGNFINYYRFNPAENRIVHLNHPVLLDESCQKFSHCLDIGCNSGVSTV